MPNIFPVSTIAEAMAAFDQIAALWNPDIEGEDYWFRGQSRVRHGLLPGLYRPSSQAAGFREETLLRYFREKGTPFVSRPDFGEWDWYFLAQHHGLPTRLLDWTENLFTAIHFAVCESVTSMPRVDFEAALKATRRPPIHDEDSPVVWVLDPALLNQHVIGDDDPRVLAADATIVDYLPSHIEDRSHKNRYPLAITPPHTNVRITSQQGVFTIHGHDTTPIEQLANSPASKVKLAQIVFDRANLPFIFGELMRCGIDTFALFPDLDHLAATLKWVCQNPV